MSKTPTRQRAKLFNITREARKHYPVSRIEKPSEQGVQAYSLCKIHGIYDTSSKHYTSVMMRRAA